MEESLNEITTEVIKEKLVDQISILFQVYKDTTPGVNLPTGVNLQEISTHLFFGDESVQALHHIYSDLLSYGTQSAYFLELIKHF